MSSYRKIGVLTSGGDAPGMNPAIRSIVRSASHFGIKVIGIKNGFEGLLEENFAELENRAVSDILTRGGTFLGSARCLEFKEQEYVNKGVQIAKNHGIEGLIVIGGDGSFRGAKDLSLAGLPAVGIPATIDNDIGCSDYCIGFDTALNTIRDAVDKIKDTTSSHHRCSFIEVMGNRSGYLAVHSAVTCGAEVVLIPEKPHEIENDIITPIMECRRRGKYHYIVIVAEGMGDTYALSKQVEDTMYSTYGIEVTTKVCVLGHIQRGGSPSIKDRIMASRFGYHAVSILNEGKGNRVVVAKNDTIIDIDISEALNMKKGIDDELYALSKILAL